MCSKLKYKSDKVEIKSKRPSISNLNYCKNNNSIKNFSNYQLLWNNLIDISEINTPVKKNINFFFKRFMNK